MEAKATSHTGFAVNCKAAIMFFNDLGSYVKAQAHTVKLLGYFAYPEKPFKYLGYIFCGDAYARVGNTNCYLSVLYKSAYFYLRGIRRIFDGVV